jgi:hypothetical membrane protein
MDQIRAGAYAAWRYLIVLYVLIVIVQFFLAGVGVFNPTESSEPYDPHSGFGFLAAGVGSFVVMVLALIAWRDRVTIGGSVALFSSPTSSSRRSRSSIPGPDRSIRSTG